MKLLLMALLVCATPQALVAAPNVAEVITSIGTVKASDIKTQERTLQRGSLLYVGDTIVVGSDSKAKIKFSDGGLLTLIANSEFRIDSYSFEMPGEKDESKASLLKGGFRALSGSIGKETEVQTPVASLGLRGTLYEVNITSPGVYYACEKGEIEIKTEAGSVRIGEKVPPQFAVVFSKNDLPKTLKTRPVQLSLKEFILEEGSENVKN